MFKNRDEDIKVDLSDHKMHVTHQAFINMNLTGSLF